MLTNGPMSYQGTGATGIGYQPTGTDLVMHSREEEKS